MSQRHCTTVDLPLPIIPVIAMIFVMTAASSLKRRVSSSPYDARAHARRVQSVEHFFVQRQIAQRVVVLAADGIENELHPLPVCGQGDWRRAARVAAVRGEQMVVAGIGERFRTQRPEHSRFVVQGQPVFKFVRNGRFARGGPERIGSSAERVVQLHEVADLIKDRRHPRVVFVSQRTAIGVGRKVFQQQFDSDLRQVQDRLIRAVR